MHEKVRADKAEAERYLSQFLPALQAHLEQKGWIDIYYQHIWDEPEDAHQELYNKTMAMLGQYAPKIKTIEATHSSQIQRLRSWCRSCRISGSNMTSIKNCRKKAGDLVLHRLRPNGSYANRFLDLHLLKVRYLHWLNFRYNAPGFLEWGYNCGEIFLPIRISTPADLWVRCARRFLCSVSDAGRALDSIRWETERDGIEDYELLMLLQAKDPKKAEAICSSMIRGFDKYDVDIGRFRAARLKLLQSLEP